MGKLEKKEGASQSNLMTLFTKNALEKERSAVGKKRLQYQFEIGDAAGQGGDYHDNFGFEEAHRNFDLATAQFLELQKKLANIEIIEPRNNVDSVNIGNSVVVRFSDEVSDEIFTILGPDDASRKSGWLSYLSPLGTNLLGKKVGDSVEYAVSKGRSQKVLVKAILPGNF